MPGCCFTTDLSISRIGNCHIHILGWPSWRMYPDLKFTITMSNAYGSTEGFMVETLLHEMIHVYDLYNFPWNVFSVMDGKREVRKCFDRGKLISEGIKDPVCPDGWYDLHGEEVFMPTMRKIRELGYGVTVCTSERDGKGELIISEYESWTENYKEIDLKDSRLYKLNII